jgi:hypothetical protein
LKKSSLPEFVFGEPPPSFQGLKTSLGKFWKEDPDFFYFGEVSAKNEAI